MTDARVCRDRRTGAGIEGVGITPTVLLEIVAVVAGSGNAVAVDGDDALGHLLIVAGFFQGDAPG